MTTPFVSIIVPTFRRPEALAACLKAIGCLDYPRNRFEVIVVDDGSPVPIAASNRESTGGVSTMLLRQDNAGPAAARNLGVQGARGDILAFTDDDCCPTPQWLREVVHILDGHPTALVGGRIVNALGSNLFSVASQMIVEEAYDYFFRRRSDLRFFASSNMAMIAGLFRECGGFNPVFRTSEDREFCDRWIRRGHPLVYAPGAVVYHRHHLTLSGFCRQHFSYGRGAFQFHRARARRSGRRMRPDLHFHVSVCRRALLTAQTGTALYMAGLVGLWQAANLAGYMWQACAETSGPFGQTCDQGLAQMRAMRSGVNFWPE